MVGDPDDAESTAPCDKCEMSIPTDADQCPICGYRPAGYNPTLLRAGQAFFTLAAVVSLLVFVAGVTRISPGLPTEIISKIAIVAPYTLGISSFFAYYIRGKRGTTPTDSSAFN
ncbi:hypothetical protein [Halorubrum sp. N11]|uniref:hypothetical protein n=1 Tax=Halorubrum sp. N11 TaxID=3402276 RepID=UPI003EBAA244